MEEWKIVRMLCSITPTAKTILYTAFCFNNHRKIPLFETVNRGYCFKIPFIIGEFVLKISGFAVKKTFFYHCYHPSITLLSLLKSLIIRILNIIVIEVIEENEKLWSERAYARA